MVVEVMVAVMVVVVMAMRQRTGPDDASQIYILISDFLKHR